MFINGSASVLIAAAVLGAVSCSKTQVLPVPSASLVLGLAANPSPVTGASCARCGTGSTERESITTVTIRETGGAAGTVTSIAMVLRDSASNAVITQGEFDAAAVTQLAGSNRLAANGTLAVLVGVHYPAGDQGRAASLAITVRVTDDRGTAVTREIIVPVTAT